MNNQPELIQMMNNKLDELTAKGIPFYQAKLVVAQAMCEYLIQSGLDKETVLKFATIITK